MAVIPAEKEAEAVRAYGKVAGADDVTRRRAVKEIYADIYGERQGYASYDGLEIVLRALHERATYVEPPDDLPDDLSRDAEALSAARDQLVAQGEADVEGAGATGRALALAGIIRARVAVCKEQRESQLHRAEMDGRRRGIQRR